MPVNPVVADVRYRELFSSMGNAAVVYEVRNGGEDFVIKDLNCAAARIEKVEPEDVIGRSVLEIFPGVREFGIFEVFQRVWRSGQPEHFPADLHQDERIAGWREDYVYKLPSGEVVAIYEDITERKQALVEQARVAGVLKMRNEELEQHIYAVSHDLRTPLVSVEGFVNELKIALDELSGLLGSGDTIPNSKANSGHVPTAPGQGTRPGIEAIPVMAPDVIRVMSPEVRANVARLLDDDIPTSLRYILGGTEKMSGLLNGLLRLARLGRAALKVEQVDMNRIAEGAVAAQAFLIEQAGAKVELGELPPCRADAGQVNQVISNLLDNAIKYRDRQRQLVVKVTGQRERGVVAYWVEDNGIGIPPELHQRVFGLFYRANPGRGEGEGLGLTIVRRALRRMGGEINLESEPGKGSRFGFTLPAAEIKEG